MKQLIKWDYDDSVKKMRPKVIRLKTLTDEMLEELHEARKELSSRGSKWNNDGKNWTGYLKDIGLARTTVHRWLEIEYDPVTKKKISKPKPQPRPSSQPIIDDQEYERRKGEAFKEDDAPSLDEAFEDVKKLIIRQDNEEVFRDFDLAALIDELRRRILTIGDVTRRHQAVNQIIKAMRELAVECERLSTGN